MENSTDIQVVNQNYANQGKMNITQTKFNDERPVSKTVDFLPKLDYSHLTKQDKNESTGSKLANNSDSSGKIEVVSSYERS